MGFNMANKEVQLDLFSDVCEIHKKEEEVSVIKDSVDSLRRGLFKRIGDQGKRINSVEQLVLSLQVEIDRLAAMIEGNRMVS